jgi:hypothetical protein
MQETADCLGIQKSTYARYEDGSAIMPPAIVRAARELLQINETFSAGMPARIEARFNKYPGVIPKEKENHHA